MLDAIPLSRETHYLITGFECGTEPRALLAREWLLGLPGAKAVENGTTIWLYRWHEDLVGFGALGTTSWNLETPMSFIPMLAVASEFQQQGHCQRIVQHLISEALKQPYCYLGLFVDAANAHAIGAYRKAGFMVVGKFKRSWGADLQMALKLREP